MDAPYDQIPGLEGQGVPDERVLARACQLSVKLGGRNVRSDLAEREARERAAAYGNIGSGNRLDFTAVGRDVNILSRLELLCKDVGRPLLMTDTFAVEVAEPVIEIGHFELRGFRRHQAVYALCQEGEQPCSPELSSAI